MDMEQNVLMQMLLVIIYVFVKIMLVVVNAKCAVQSIISANGDPESLTCLLLIEMSAVKVC